MGKDLKGKELGRGYTQCANGRYKYSFRLESGKQTAVYGASVVECKRNYTTAIKAYEEGLFNKVITTNLVYQKPELLERSYYQTADMYRYLANIVDVINKNISTDNLKGTRRKIESVLERNNLIKELR